MLSRLNGIFAFALWDASARRYLIARDPMGVCPLYHGRDAGGRPYAVISASDAASLKALNDLEIKVRKDTVDSLTGRIDARTADGKDVIIGTKRLTDTATELVIRVGPFGDNAVHTAIYDKIKSNM